MQDRDSRFVIACATGPLSENLIEQAVTTTVARTHQRELHWFSDGWHGYQSVLVRRYHHRSPAMALGLTEHLWSFQDLLTTRIPTTP